MATYKMVNAEQLDADMVSVADSIRAKGGTSEKLTWPEGYKAAVEAIQTGGAAPVEEKDVNFYDYDGTLLYSYTLAEAQALTELPPGPTREGLVFQTWNWTLEELKAHNRYCVVGALYITDDGATRLHIKVTQTDRATIPICFRQTVENGVTVNWGDGSSTETFAGSGTTDITPDHEYAKPGEYVISLLPKEGCTFSLGSGTTTRAAVGIAGSNGDVYRDMLRKVEIGTRANLSNSCFVYCCSLCEVSLSNDITGLGPSMFQHTYSLKALIWPRGQSVVNYTFNSGAGLRIFSMPGNVMGIGMQVFYGAISLTHISIPDNITRLSSYVFNGCRALSKVILPNITQIGATTFSNCVSLKLLDFTRCTEVTGLTNVNILTNLPSDCEIRVPASLYDEWIVATNWATYADNIVAV